MTEAGLIERFPDGARVFYRLSSDLPARRLIDTVLDLLDIAANAADDRRLEEVRRDREAAAGAYFERVAPQWDRIPLAVRLRERSRGRHPASRGRGPL
jgi:hypothetical protein